MAKARFILEKPNSYGEQQVYVNFTHAQTRDKAPTGIYVRKKDLDIKVAKEGQPKPDNRFFLIKNQVAVNDANLRAKNEELRGVKLKAEQLLLEFNKLTEPYTASDLKLAFMGERQKAKTGAKNILMLDDVFHKDYKTWLVKKKGNSEHWFRGEKSRVKVFALYMGSEDYINLKGITESKLNDFVDWMFDEKNFEPGYIKKTNTSVRKLFEYLQQKGYPVKKGLHLWKASRKIKVTEKPALFITDKEYEQLYAHIPSKPYLEVAKDCFIILYNTGSRYGETKIDPADIQGNRLINYNRKTDKTLKKPINNDLAEVLKKYDYNPPFVNDVILNRHLKELFKEAGLDRVVKKVTTPGGKRKEEIFHLHDVISTKFGRKSLISNYIKQGIHEKWIRENFSGHANPINMDPYLGFDDEYTEKALELFDRKKKED